MSLNRLTRYPRAYGQPQLRVVGDAEQLAKVTTEKSDKEWHIMLRLAFSRLPVVVGCRIGRGGKEKHLVVSIRVHPAVPKEEDPLCSAQERNPMRD
jgi:hypothetical protein